MLKAEQVPSEVIRKAMHTFQVQMDEEGKFFRAVVGDHSCRRHQCVAGDEDDG